MKKNPIDKFDGHKPLIQYPNDYYPQKYDLKYYKFEPPKALNLYGNGFGAPITGNLPPFIFGVKAREDELIKYDFLDCPDGGDLIVHDRVLAILQKMCPSDFQVFEVLIKNLDQKDDVYLNKNFHMINVVNKIDALDMNKTQFHKSPNGFLFPTKRFFKEEDCWESHLLALEKLENNPLFHPKLAKALRHSKGVQFLSDQEAPC